MTLHQHVHAKALQVAASYKRAEADLVSALQEVENKRVFIHQGYTSLFNYSVQALGLSESVTANFITVARKAREIPALQRAIQAGELSVSKARKITPVLMRENQAEWVRKAQTLPTRELEQEVARAAPAQAVAERVKFVSEDRLEFRTGISRRLRDKLLRVQDLESQRVSRPASLEETLEALADLYLKAKDPVRRAERALTRSSNAGACVTVTRTQVIPAAVRHRVYLRDQGQCTHRDSDGRRCGNRRWIDLHHILPRREDGPNTAENLTTLCSSHHRFEHGKD